MYLYEKKIFNLILKLLLCFTVKDYVENITSAIGLVDKLSKNVIPETCAKDALYPAHLTPAQIHAGVRNGKLHQGTFRASRYNYLEGTAVVNGYEKPVSILTNLKLTSIFYVLISLETLILLKEFQQVLGLNKTFVNSSL